VAERDPGLSFTINRKPSMATLTELLPPQKSSPRSAIHFDPATRVVRIDTRRSSTSYAVVEFPTDFKGRAFRLEKLDAGSDAESEAYEVLCGRAGEFDRCDCRGFLRWNLPCKHVNAMKALIENEWV
jgi:hypothetical protein